MRNAQANVSIGDDFSAPLIHCEETKQAITNCLRRHGEAGFTKRNRALCLWRKIRDGKIAESVAALIRRDNAVLFAEFDRAA